MRLVGPGTLGGFHFRGGLDSGIVGESVEYDRILVMLETTTETEIALTPTESGRFVLADWGRKGQVHATNSRYVR